MYPGHMAALPEGSVAHIVPNPMGPVKIKIFMVKGVLVVKMYHCLSLRDTFLVLQHMLQKMKASCERLVWTNLSYKDEKI